MIEINKKEDIIIPFDKIGDENWEKNTREIIESFAEVNDDELNDPIPEEQVAKLENRLGTTLPESLKTFYTTFGIADIGEQLQSFDEIGWIKDIWAEQPEYGPDFTDEDQKYIPFLISFSDYLGNGNMFCFHSETKEIYYFDHESSPFLIKLFDRFDDYLKGCLIFVQSELFGEDTDQEDVEEWTEDAVSNLFGHEVVKRWRY